MTKLMYILLFITTLAGASCDNYYFLGIKQDLSSISSKDTIIWDSKSNDWSVSKPILKPTNSACKNSGYILVNSNEMEYNTSLYHQDYYDLKKGWNHFTTPIEGVDVAKTFLDAEFVYIYDKHSSAWAGFSAKEELMKKIKSTRILELRYIEPKRDFYVLSNKKMRVTIASKLPNSKCQKIMKDENYDIIYDSGLDKAFSFNDIKSVALASRYFSHTRKGVYNDSRVMIIVPKIKKLSTNKKPKKYGPAIPKMMIHFNEAYEEQKFFAYDYLNESCHEGYFPSKKRPPAPTMKKVELE